MKAKKSYGQHFLNNESIAENIANSLTLFDQYDHIIEIGPGKGMLTKYLLKTPKILNVIEADRDMVTYLNNQYPKLAPYIVSEDVLKVRLHEVTDHKPFGLIGNYPYNISSQIVFLMLELKEYIPEMVGMFQKEVAQRIVAKPGSRTYGILSVFSQAFYEGEIIIDVPPENFTPPPRVDSAVIRLTRKPNLELGCNFKKFREIVKISFGQRRKMLRTSLKGIYKGNPELKTPFFEKRPEMLSCREFVEITNLLNK